MPRQDVFLWGLNVDDEVVDKMELLRGFFREIWCLRRGIVNVLLTVKVRVIEFK
jgi:hypothetical protein